MIRKLIRQMLTAQIFSALTVSLCLLIDNIMIGRFLGVQAIAAYGLANPILLVIGALGTMLSAGVQVACGKSLGRGLQEETNAGYSSAVALTAVFSFAFVALVLLFRAPLATLMGAGTEGQLFTDTRDYLTGFIFGAPATMGALILVPFLQMAGQSTLLIVAVLGMTVADVAFDLLNVFVFHDGMFGMGLASSLSYYVALVVAAFYFCSKKCVFRFSLRDVTMRKIKELFSSGVPAVFNMASTVILIFVLNKILLVTGGATAVAAYSVVTTIGNASNCITTGIGGVTLTMSGILYHEEDRTGLREMLNVMASYCVKLGLAVGVMLMLCAPIFVSLFIKDAGATKDMTVLGVRLYALGLVPCCLNNALKNHYQGTGRVVLTEITSLLEGAAFPALAAFLLSLALGTTGVWFYFLCGESLALLFLAVLTRVKMRRAPWKNDAMLLLDDSFSVAPEDLMELDLQTVEDVSEAASAVGAFCIAHGQSAVAANRIALCVEELGSNVVQHGFTKDDKPHHLLIRVLQKPDRCVVRLRDDCRSFDPNHYVPKDKEKDMLGIRLVLKLADEIRYTYSLNLNNLTVILREKGMTAIGE